MPAIPSLRSLDSSNDPTSDLSIRDCGIACKTIFDCTAHYNPKGRFERCELMDADTAHWVPGFED